MPLVVVAHEDSLTRALVRSALEDDGFDVREASSASQALRACRDSPPDVLFLDTVLCDEEKLPLLSEIKADPRLYSTAVVLITNMRTARAAARALDKGAQDVITLPIKEADVIARARSAARTKALQTELLGRGRVLEVIAYVDPMTRLYNRRFMTGQLNALIASSERHARDLSILLIDVDHFKSVNDELGHSAGDAALVEIAGRLRSNSRQEDYVGRWGGEEFLVILPDIDAEGARIAAEHLREAVADLPMVLEGASRSVSISVGLATRRRGEAAKKLLERADEALYEAKDAGRDRVCGEGAKRFRRGGGPQDTSAKSGRLA